MHLTVTVNGSQRELETEPRTLLVHFLRDKLGLTGTKSAATPASAAPAPSIWTARPSSPARCSPSRPTAREITTIEGLARTASSTRCRRASGRSTACSAASARPA